MLGHIIRSAIKEPGSNWKHDVKVAVLTAGLTAIVTGVSEILVDKLRDSLTLKKDEPKSSPGTEKA
jgi:hypothetical protein